jgi:hypothetical protein
MATADRPFAVNYSSPTAKAVRGGQSPDENTLGPNAPAFDPTSMQKAFIKGSTNALNKGFFNQDFDPAPVQAKIDQAGTHGNFGGGNNQADPKNLDNKDAEEFLRFYQAGVQRNLIQQPVSSNNLGPYMSKPAPYQADDRLVGQAEPFPGSSGTKIS